LVIFPSVCGLNSVLLLFSDTFVVVYGGKAVSNYMKIFKDLFRGFLNFATEFDVA
jgi:hypothetical protein